MGNKQVIAEEDVPTIGNKSCSTTPKKQKEFKEDSNLVLAKKSKSEKKEEYIYSNKKPFETYENTNIFGYYLNTDPEDREYFVSCPVCKNLNLDTGFSRNITCKKCFTVSDVETRKIISMPSVKVEEDFLVKKKSKIQNRSVRYLNNLVLQIDKDSLISNFFENEKINYELIVKKILLPYFKIKSRILKNSFIFHIGEIGFKVVGVSPCKKGIISSQTNIQCNSFYSSKTKLNRILLLTTQKYNNFNQDSLIQEFFTNDRPLVSSIEIEEQENKIMLNKNEVSKIKMYEFYVRNAEPEAGVLTKETKITIENKDIYNISKLTIAIVKNNTPIFRNANERKTYEDYVTKEYYKPYFLSGVKKYIERGDTFQIENLELFVLDSVPEQGFIVADSNVIFKFGFTKEECLEKILSDDNKYVQTLMRRESDERTSSNSQSQPLASSPSGNASATNGQEENNTFLRRINSETHRQMDNLLFSTNSSSLTRPRNSRSREYQNQMLREMFTTVYLRRPNRSNENIFNSLNEELNSVRVLYDALRSNMTLTRRNSEDLQIIIDNLPTLKVDEAYKKMIDTKREENNEENRCVICMCEFEIEQVLKTVPCFHLFHVECIDKWLKENPYCPLCKSELK